MTRKPGHALSDIDYMRAKAAEGFDHDPFLMQSSWQMENEVMRDAGLVPEHQSIPGDLPPSIDRGEPTFSRLRRGKIYGIQRKNKKTNFVFALGGGLAVVVPMIIMTLFPGKTSSLVTSSAFVFVFSTIVAGRVDLKPQEILGVTAAYAAVLVVFVGTKQSSKTS